MAKKKQYQHIDMQHNEVQNAKEHILNTTPEDVVEGQHWYDSVSKRPKYYNGTSVKDYGKEYTAGTGITIDNSNETIEVTDYNKILKNVAKDTTKDLAILGNIDYDDLLGSIAIGKGSNVYGSTAFKSMAIGTDATCHYRYCTALGCGAKANSSVNNGDHVNYRTSIAIGAYAKADGENTIMIGKGKNDTANTLAIGFDTSSNISQADPIYSNTYILLDGTTGLIPDERISSNIARTSDVPTSASDVGALPDTTKYASSIDLTMDSSTYVITAQLKDQDGNNIGTAKNIDLPLETLAIGIDYDETTNELILNLENGTSKRASIASIVDGLQTEITSSNKLSADLISDGTTNKTVTQTEKNTWSNKQNAITSSNKLSADLLSEGTTNKLVSASEKSTWSNKQNAISDLSTIRTNASNGASAYSTIQGYGNIVTHNANEFQTTLGYTPCKVITASNTALTVSTGGEVTWNIDNSIGSKFVGVHIYETSTGEDVTSSVSITVSASQITVKMNSDTNISANTYHAIIIGSLYVADVSSGGSGNDYGDRV